MTCRQMQKPVLHTITSFSFDYIIYLISSVVPPVAACLACAGCVGKSTVEHQEHSPGPFGTLLVHTSGTRQACRYGSTIELASCEQNHYYAMRQLFDRFKIKGVYVCDSDVYSIACLLGCSF